MVPTKRSTRGCISLLSAIIVSVSCTFAIYHPVCGVSLVSGGDIIKFDVCFAAVFLVVFATVG